MTVSTINTPDSSMSKVLSFTLSTARADGAESAPRNESRVLVSDGSCKVPTAIENFEMKSCIAKAMNVSSFTITSDSTFFQAMLSVPPKDVRDGLLSLNDGSMAAAILNELTVYLFTEIGYSSSTLLAQVARLLFYLSDEREILAEIHTRHPLIMTTTEIAELRSTLQMNVISERAFDSFLAMEVVLRDIKEVYTLTRSDGHTEATHAILVDCAQKLQDFQRSRLSDLESLKGTTIPCEFEQDVYQRMKDEGPGSMGDKVARLEKTVELWIAAHIARSLIASCTV